MTRNTLVFALKLLVSVSIIAVLVSKFDFSQISSRLGALSYGYVFLALCVCVLLAINNTFRWQVVLKAIEHPLPFGFVFRTQYIGGFFNQALPSTIGGDAMRIYLAHKIGAPLQKSVNSVVLERMVALSGLIFLVTALQPFVLGRVDSGFAHYVFPALSLLAVSGIAIVMVFDRLPLQLRRMKFFTAFANMAVDAKRVFLSPRYVLAAMTLGISGFALLSMVAYFCALSLGVKISIMDALVLVPPAILVATLPISIAGWGVREGAMIATLSYAGVAEVDAITISIVFGLTIAVSSLPGGVFWITDKSQKKQLKDQPCGSSSEP